MFPPEVQIIFDARAALESAQQNDPKFEQLVQALIERTKLPREEVLSNIVRLANGDLSV